MNVDFNKAFLFEIQIPHNFLLFNKWKWQKVSNFSTMIYMQYILSLSCVSVFKETT